MIPRRLHRIWLDDPMPEHFRDYGLQWAKLHPEWECTDWTDSEKLPALHNQTLFDTAEVLYPDDWKRLQADLLRLELLWEYGGVYVDTDVRPLRKLDSILNGESCVAARSPQHIRGIHPVTNCFMAAEPRHPWIRALIDGADAALREHGHKSLAQSVGPWHLTRTLARTLASEEWDVTVHDPAFFTTWVHHDWNTAARRRGEGV